MSKEPIKDNKFAEEADVLVLLKYFERGIMNVINFFLMILKFFYSVIIYTLRAIILNIRLIATVVILGAIAGYALERFSPKKYEAGMVVRTFFDSQYQLATNY